MYIESLDMAIEWRKLGHVHTVKYKQTIIENARLGMTVLFKQILNNTMVPFSGILTWIIRVEDECADHLTTTTTTAKTLKAWVQLGYKNAPIPVMI